jgi:inhibitor of cysteine peptidase
MCTQALVPFTHSVALDISGLKAGDYKVMAAGLETTFNLAQDNGPAEGDDSSMNTGGLIEGALYVDGVTIGIMESMPLQAAAEISGSFADGCTTLGDVVVNRLDNTFYITLKATRPADQMCTQALVPFTQSVALNIYGLKAGDYKVVVGESEATFNLPSDNGPVAGETAMPYDAPIMSFEIVVEKSEPTKVTLKINTAYIPACETFVLTTEEVGSEIKLKAQIHLPAGMICRAPTKQMTEIIPLDVTALTAGSYTVTINGQSNSFEMP